MALGKLSIFGSVSYKRWEVLCPVLWLCLCVGALVLSTWCCYCECRSASLIYLYFTNYERLNNNKKKNVCRAEEGEMRIMDADSRGISLAIYYWGDRIFHVEFSVIIKKKNLEISSGDTHSEWLGNLNPRGSGGPLTTSHTDYPLEPLAEKKEGYFGPVCNHMNVKKNVIEYYY